MILNFLFFIFLQISCFLILVTWHFFISLDYNVECGHDRKIPTLREVFTAFPETPVNIDVKLYNEQLFHKVTWSIFSLSVSKKKSSCCDRRRAKTLMKHFTQKVLMVSTPNLEYLLIMTRISCRTRGITLKATHLDIPNNDNGQFQKWKVDYSI